MWPLLKKKLNKTVLVHRLLKEVSSFPQSHSVRLLVTIPVLQGWNYCQGSSTLVQWISPQLKRIRTLIPDTQHCPVPSPCIPDRLKWDRVWLLPAPPFPRCKGLRSLWSGQGQTGSCKTKSLLEHRKFWPTQNSLRKSCSETTKAITVKLTDPTNIKMDHPFCPCP